MNSRNHAIPIAFVIWAGGHGATGCGNYSNEDLEFMNAIPQREDITAEAPAQAAALTTASTSEAWRRTFGVIRQMDDAAEHLLRIVSSVRSNYPNAREDNARTWGPFPMDNHPGWQAEFRMIKEETEPPQFSYRLVAMPRAELLPPTGDGVEILAGTFSLEGGIHGGSGSVQLLLDEARAAGLVFSGLEDLRTLAISYATGVWPRRVQAEIVKVPPADPTQAAERTSYLYEGGQNGDGAMQFSFTQDLIVNQGGIETALVESRWRGTGEGRSDVSITGADIAANSVIECWDRTFRVTYNFQSWAPVDVVGDIASCISRL